MVLDSVRQKIFRKTARKACFVRLSKNKKFLSKKQRRVEKSVFDTPLFCKKAILLISDIRIRITSASAGRGSPSAAFPRWRVRDRVPEPVLLSSFC